MRRDNDDAVTVAKDHIAGKNRRVAAADSHVDLDRLMQCEIGRRTWPVMIGGKAEFCDLGRIAKAPIGDDASDAALHQPGHQYRARGRRAGILAAVHHQHRTWRTILDCPALRMASIAKHIDLVEVFARRHVAQRESFADQYRLVRAERMHILDHLDSKTALEERGRDRCGRDGLQFAAGRFAEFWH